MPPKSTKIYKKTFVKKTDESFNADSFNNAKYLVIVESPSKCKKIDSYLGLDYKCIASKGHIRHIDNLKSIDTKTDFSIMFSIIEEKAKHVEFMRTVIDQFDKSNIILATDDDREGEAIAWHICDIFGLPVETTKRIIFHEITQPAILKAVENPTIINMNLVNAQKARQVLDMIVGFKISPLLWKYLFNNKTNGLSAGRCQTPALRLVYDNEKLAKEMEFKYKTVGHFFSQNIPFILNHEFREPEQIAEFLEKSKTFEHMFSLGSPKEISKSPPKPFNTSNLLQVASNVLHYSPNETMSICQKLYQNGDITYMRTENTKYSAVFLKQAQEFIIGEFNKTEYVGNLDVLLSNESANPHEAIRVTHLEKKSVVGFDARTSSLYRLIWRNTVESCMSDAVFKTIGCEITAPEKHKYKYTLEIPVFLGWKKIGVSRSVEEENPVANDSALYLFFQSIKQPAKIPYNYIESTVSAEHLNHHYTEASLIKKLEEIGIGRPSTFAFIVETIQERGYVKKQDIDGKKVECTEFKLRETTVEILKKEKAFGNEKNKLVIQPTGVITVEFLIQHFQNLFSYDYTRIMEEKLDEIGGNGAEGAIIPGSAPLAPPDLYSKICRDCYDEIKTLSKPIAAISKQTFPINDKYELVFQKSICSLRRKLEDGSYEYKPIKQSIKIDLDKLKAGGYTYEDLVEIQNDYLGVYEGMDMYMKIGPYGAYVEWGENRESIYNISKPLNSITLFDVQEMILKKRGNAVMEDGKQKRSPPPAPSDNNLIRTLNEYLSIRKGKFGFYVFYKKPEMKKPEFLSLKEFKDDIFKTKESVLIDWIKQKYRIT